ncbi:tetratricopeptide repeat protein [bacterium]|nr:tetratricopeptide repeat protein [bacterium]
MFGMSAKKTGCILAGMALTLALCAPAEADPLQQDMEKSPEITYSEMRSLMKSEEELIDQRTRAEKKLKADPNDYRAHLLLGYVLHHAEGDLGRARYHLEKAHSLVVKADQRGERGARLFYSMICEELSMVLTEMDQYDAKIRLIKEMTTNGLGARWESEMAWPLMKLDKEYEARQIIQKCLNSSDPVARINAWNTLGALEADRGHYQASYDAFDGLNKELSRYLTRPNLTFCRNIGEACLPLGRYEEAEKYYTLAASLPFDDASFSNPYQDLTRLYLGQARFSEAINSLKKTYDWSNATKPFLYQQSMAENTQLYGMTLLEVGRPHDAVLKLNKLAQRPDRRGGTSLRIDQTEAGNLLCWNIAMQTDLERTREALASLDFVSGLISFTRNVLDPDCSPNCIVCLCLRELRLRRNIDTSSKRIAALAANSHRIRASMLPYDTQSVNTVEWFRPRLVEIWGTGLSEAALEDIKKNPPEHYLFSEPFMTALYGEIAFLRGSYRQSAEYLSRAMDTLPRQEALLRLRTQTRLAMALQGCGEKDKATELFKQILEKDGAMLRELKARIPISIDVSAQIKPNIRKAIIKGLKRSPRFKVGKSNIHLKIDSTDTKAFRISLADEHGNVIRSVSCTAQFKDLGLMSYSDPTGITEFLLFVQDYIFSPPIKISGLDDSLDSSNTDINAVDFKTYR